MAVTSKSVPTADKAKKTIVKPLRPKPVGKDVKRTTRDVKPGSYATR